MWGPWLGHAEGVHSAHRRLPHGLPRRGDAGEIDFRDVDIVLWYCARQGNPLDAKWFQDLERLIYAICLWWAQFYVHKRSIDSPEMLSRDSLYCMFHRGWGPFQDGSTSPKQNMRQSRIWPLLHIVSPLPFFIHLPPFISLSIAFLTFVVPRSENKNRLRQTDEQMSLKSYLEPPLTATWV